MKKTKFNNIKNFLKKLPWIFGENTLLTFFGFLILSLILGALIFYQYTVLAEKQTAEFIEKTFEFKEDAYQEVLKTWQEKEESFKRADFKDYLNPFRLIKERWDPVAFLEKNGKESLSELSEEKLEEVLAILNLYEFYTSREEKLPLIAERAIIWEDFGLGTKEEYVGSRYQNDLLLEKLKANID